MAPGDDDGDADYESSKGEKWSKEMLPCVSSRPDFMRLLLESMQVPVTVPPHPSPTLPPLPSTLYPPHPPKHSNHHHRAAPKYTLIYWRSTGICSIPDPSVCLIPRVQEEAKHREHCWWQWRSRKLQDDELIRLAGTDKDGTKVNFRTDFSARESYEQQDAATGQKPNVGSVCVSIVQHSPTKRMVSTYVKEVRKSMRVRVRDYAPSYSHQRFTLCLSASLHSHHTFVRP